MEPIVVSNLFIESVTGPTCYEGESGFSALTAYVKSDDPAVIKKLQTAAAEHVAVIVSCAKLEIEGRVGNLHVPMGEMKGAVAINIDELRYFEQGHK